MEQPSDLTGILVCAGLCLFPILLFAMTFYLFRVRIGKLEKKAQELGFSFDATGFKFESVDEPVFSERLPPFNLFSQGRSRKVRNVMKGEWEGVPVTVFDYRYKPVQDVWTQTVVLIEQDGLDLPQFLVRPRNLADHLDVPPGEEVEVEDAELFSKRYVVQGVDEKRIRELFGPEVRGYFREQAGMSAEGAGDCVIVYRARDAKSPEQIEPFLDRVVELIHLMKT